LNPDQLPQLFTAFLRRIGIEVRTESIAAETFLPGIEIVNGVLVYDPEKMLYPGDLLHEAGHIALTPAGQRATLCGNVVTQNPQRASDEVAVMLWTYAACRELDIPLETVFHPNGYKGDNDWLMENYEAGNHIGLPLLKWMGLTDDHFPKMIKWLR